ncbi:MAG TPA: acyl-CoA dehydrogenase family protein, partial [Polyangiales bacterium]
MAPTALPLKWMRQLAGSKALERAGLLEPLERMMYRGSKAAVHTAQRARPVLDVLRRARMERPRQPDLPFDLTPSDAQRLVRDTMQRFARESLRPAARGADEACAPPARLLAEAHGLGLSELAVPHPLGEATDERSPMTNALVVEDLAYGDAGLALAVLAPIAVAHALVDHGTGHQQSEYLPALAGKVFYPAAVACLEPRPL